MNRKASLKKKSVRIVLLSIGFLVLIRLILPFIILHFANKSLREMKGYYGHIEDIDLAIIRGAYRIDSIYINKHDSVTHRQTPFFGAKHIDLSVEWKALFHGGIVGELVFESPTLFFTRDKVEPKNLQKDSTSFKKLLDDFMPLKVNRFEITEGVIGYKDQTSSPPVDISMTHTYVLAQNLRNSYDSSTLLPATIHATAGVYEGTLDLNMKLNPLADKPTFDLNAKLQDTNLVKLNEFFQAYAKVDVNKGTFGLYTEIASKQGQFKGYVKPLIKDLDVLGKEDRHDNFLRKTWEAIIGGVGQIFKNQPEDQVATRIPFEGRIENPETNVWYAISHVLQNAFIQALAPSIENKITIASVASPGKEKKASAEKVSNRKETRKEKREARREKRARSHGR